MNSAKPWRQRGELDTEIHENLPTFMEIGRLLAGKRAGLLKGFANGKCREDSTHAGKGLHGAFVTHPDVFRPGRQLRLREGVELRRKAICSDKRLSSMDDQLARLYKAARAAATNASALETEQKSWLSSRDRCTNTACLKKTYADRIAALSGPSTAPAFGSFTGTYKMQNGEALIQQTGERIKFSINATYRQNTGEITGEVPLMGNSAKYVDQDADCILLSSSRPASSTSRRTEPAGWVSTCQAPEATSARARTRPNSKNDPRCLLTGSRAALRGRRCCSRAGQIRNIAW